MCTRTIATLHRTDIAAVMRLADRKHPPRQVATLAGPGWLAVTRAGVPFYMVSEGSNRRAKTDGERALHSVLQHGRCGCQVYASQKRQGCLSSVACGVRALANKQKPRKTRRLLFAKRRLFAMDCCSAWQRGWPGKLARQGAGRC